MLTIDEIKKEVMSLQSDKFKKNVVRMGLSERNTIGVSTSNIRNIARKVGKNNELAWELWRTNIHEYRLLATLVFDNEININESHKLINEVRTWALCDHVSKSLLINLEYVDDLMESWYCREELYIKRSAFVLITAQIVKKKDKIQDESIDRYLEMIFEEAWDTRIHVKKAISWALREIGKINEDYQERAILMADELIQRGGGYKWVGMDAIKELENLIKIDERERLISRSTKMGSIE